METSVSGSTDAPDASVIIDLLTKRLYDTGQDMPEIKPNGSIRMLMDRFSPGLRQRVYKFLQNCIFEDVLYTKVLVLKHAAEPNRFAAMVHAMVPIRDINRGWAGHKVPAMQDLLEAYRELCMQELDTEANISALNQLIGVHLARAIGANDSEFGIIFSTFLPKHPEFLTAISHAVPALTALMEQYSVYDYSIKKVDAVFEVAAYVCDHIDESERVTSFIRSHRSFDRALLDEMLATPRTPVEDGRL